MTTSERYRAILARHLPPQAVDRAYAFLDRYRVHFHITRGRRSKYGDYRCPQPGHPFHEMSVNGDLPPAFFLWVFLHEAAHLETRLHHPAAAAHGHEWQAEYACLLGAARDCFPPAVQPLVDALVQRIPLKRSLLRQAEALLRTPADGAAPLRLDDLEAGSLFRLASRPDRLFRSLERRRTRWRCAEVPSGRQYLVNGAAEVLPEEGV